MKKMFETDTIQLLRSLPTDLKLQKAFKEGCYVKKQRLTQGCMSL